MTAIGVTAVDVTAVRNDLKLWTIITIGSTIILWWSLFSRHQAVTPIYELICEVYLKYIVTSKLYRSPPFFYIEVHIHAIKINSENFGRTKCYLNTHCDFIFVSSFQIQTSFIPIFVRNKQYANKKSTTWIL